MKGFITVVILSVLFFGSAQAQNTFPSGTGTFAGVGTLQPSTAFHVYNNTTTLSNANFITIENRGVNASYTTSHVLGGLLFAGYRDIRAPANVAGIWAVRTSANGGLNSWGDLVFATTNNAQNITADNALPAERMRIVYNGYVGIGTSTPSANLNIDPQGAGAILIGNSTTTTGNFTSLTLGISAQTNGYARIQSIGSAGSSFGTLALNPGGGNVGIGTADTKGYMLAVAGSAIATKIVVKQQASWPDFVFEPTYQLPSLQSVENFILFNKHLPDVPSATAIERDGIDLGNNQSVLLKKIEELTLYLIDQDKEIKLLKEQSAVQNKKLEAQQSIINQLSRSQITEGSIVRE